jgi:hypothetical protein
MSFFYLSENEAMDSQPLLIARYFLSATLHTKIWDRWKKSQIESTDSPIPKR